jgi:sugar/nucleoside kinase (ribokinase family)
VERNFPRTAPRAAALALRSSAVPSPSTRSWCSTTASSNHILPEQIHILNVSFLVPEMRREFGGCAGNIAYNLKLLGGDPLIMATVGDDAGPYLERLDRLGLARTHVTQMPGTFTAQAFITTDLDDNQITAFHPGAMNILAPQPGRPMPGSARHRLARRP